MAEELSANGIGWPEEIRLQFLAKDYSVVVEYYESLIASQPWESSYYWYLGLVYLMQGYEADAQAIWFAPMLNHEGDALDTLHQELCSILAFEAEQQLLCGQINDAHLIFWHLLDLQPHNLDYLLSWLKLSLQTESISLNILEAIQEQISLNSERDYIFNDNLMLTVFAQLISRHNPDSVYLSLAEKLLDLAKNLDGFLDVIFRVSTHVFYSLRQTDVALSIVKMGLRKSPKHLDLLGASIDFYNNLGCFQEALDLAKKYFDYCQTVDLQLLGNHLVIKSLLRMGNLWTETQFAFDRHKKITQNLIQSAPPDLSNNLSSVLITCLSHLNYFEDQPSEYRNLQNQISSLCQENIEQANSSIFHKYRKARLTKRHDMPLLKIGYLSQSLRRHSIGWLIRWLFRYHDHTRFQTNIYQAHHAIDTFTKTYLSPYVNMIYDFQQGSALDIAEQIFADEIDILIDLDSVTFATGVNVLALKPAKLQVAWLGWDAPGLPAVDYFICDHHVLPPEADTYYQEKLWRLPETYIAVDGFEVGTPSLRRDLLGIPNDAVVYLSAQTASKRHPDLVQLQMAILQGVPNSHFLIKGLANQAGVQELFCQFAQEAGVGLDRLHFLALDDTELTHRANLLIADIILDTYPYNGATTTLETLWLGIPIVTLVGQQFSARNSYAFMSHVDVIEGIAWSEEEYVEWGIRLGTDRDLRFTVSQKLKASRSISTLWNAKKFTGQMENAYQQMWVDFMDS